MSRPYASPRDFEKAMKSRLTAYGKQHGLNLTMVFRGFYFSRLAARVFHHDPEGWLLKGGQALLLRYPSAARLSRDIDLQYPSAEDIGEARTALLAAARVDLGDFFVFVPTSYAEHADEIGGAKQSFDVMLGIRRLDSVAVDFVTGRHPTSVPDVVPLSPGIAMPWPVDWPDARLYPLADHVADKICAMYERHNGIASSRWRDLADLLLISQRERLRGAAVRVALDSEIRRRTGLGIDLQVPQEFRVPGPSWARGYESAAGDVSGLRGCRSMAEAGAAADAFLSPVLHGPDPGEWDPAAAMWSAQDVQR
ncbi:nucleotidyl transferase AbiEii/AbiGii toxin family protein [Herbidospora cretacea]|uniref:nucleotidyl transferase AbiEii/AbiGii toxin family protein n=1 Tax=Herbidospora cretacea TaxID=28444 RepID=UPI0007C8769B|nr:nucleotidyl transferase AbiEii/AbiGii toxin family protein [Herbidospora cretacea]